MTSRQRLQKALALPLCAVLALAGCTGDGSGTPGAPDRSTTAEPPIACRDTAPGWTTVFDEDFNTLDRSRWNVLDATAHANEESNLWARNVSVAGGRLRVQARAETTTTTHGGTRRYTSGYLDTVGKFAAPAYFRAVVRAKVPQEQGMWAAPLWLRPSDGSGGEIDVVETYGDDAEAGSARAVATVHTQYGRGHRQSSFDQFFAELGDPAGTAWHVYVLEKVPGLVTVSVDGIPFARWTSAAPSWFDDYFETGKTWDLRVNLQVGSNVGRDNHPDDRTDWAAGRTAMLVDYVRVSEAPRRCGRVAGRR